MGHNNYDEFGLFHENATEWDLPFDEPPKVARVTVTLNDGRHISGLMWGDSRTPFVLLHGGAQNAHTYDTLCLALDVPVLALDLPGHGHSDGGRDDVLSPQAMADDIAEALRSLCDGPVALAGMSLGGLVALHLAHNYPKLIARLAFIDITPGVNQEKAGHISAFINGPSGFESFDDLLARTIEHNPTRSESSLRRGILHNAIQLEDGTWVWRWAQHRSGPLSTAIESVDLWELLGELKQPAMLIRGMDFGSVVDDDDEAEFLDRLPEATVVRVQGAGHSVQGDQPLVLAEILVQFLADS